MISVKLECLFQSFCTPICGGMVTSACEMERFRAACSRLRRIPIVIIRHNSMGVPEMRILLLARLRSETFQLKHCYQSWRPYFSCVSHQFWWTGSSDSFRIELAAGMNCRLNASIWQTRSTSHQHFLPCQNPNLRRLEDDSKRPR